MNQKWISLLVATALLAGCTPSVEPEVEQKPIEQTQEGTEENTQTAEETPADTHIETNEPAQPEEEVEAVEQPAEEVEQIAEEPVEEEEAPKLPLPDRKVIGQVDSRESAQEALVAAIGMYQELIKLSQDKAQMVDVETPYWTQTYTLLPTYYTSKEDLRQDLMHYYSPGAADQILSQIRVFEMGGRIGLPEMYSASLWDMEDLRIAPWEASENSYLLNTKGAFEDKKTDYKVHFVSTEAGDRLDTVPGSGKTVVVRNSLMILENYKAEPGLEIRIPVFVGPTAEELNTSLQETLTSMEAWQNEVKEFNATTATNPEEDVTGVGLPAQEVWQNWSILKQHDDILVLSLGVSNFIQGAAHPNHGRTIITLDLNTGNRVALMEIFDNQALARVAMDRFIEEYLKTNKEGFYNDADKVFEGIGDNRGFGWTAGGLIIYFDQYEIAPYAAGFPEIEIPWDVVLPHMKEEYKKRLIPGA